MRKNIDPAFYSGIYPNLCEFNFKCDSLSKDVQQVRSNPLVLPKLVEIALDVFGQKPGYRARIGSNLFLLAGLLFDHPFYRVSDLEIRTGPEDLARLQRIVRYITQNLNRRITLKEISAREHVSYHHLSRFIRDKLGMSFATFLNRLRLQEASDLLLIGGKSVQEISKQIGFGSLNSFYRFFKTQMGMTPNEYKRTVMDQHLSFDSPDKAGLPIKTRAAIRPVLFPWIKNLRKGESSIGHDAQGQAAIDILVDFLGRQSDKGNGAGVRNREK